MFGFAFGNWLARLPAVRDHLGASTMQMSFIGLTIAVGAVAGLLFAGRTVTWLGPRRALFYSAIGQAIALPLGSLMLWTGFVIPGLVVLALFGMSFSTGDVAMNVSGAAAERALGKSRMPLLHGGYAFGGVVSMGTGALAEYFSISVPVHLAAVAVTILVCVNLALRQVPRVEPEHSVAETPADGQPELHTRTHTGPIHTGPIHTVTTELAEAAAASHTQAVPPGSTPTQPPYNAWKDPRIVLIGFVALSMGLTEGTATDWLPLALTDHRAFSNSSAALVLGAFFIAMMLTRFLGGWILERFGRVAALRGGAVLVGASIVLVYAVPFAWAGVTAAIFWGIGCALGFPIAVSAAADNPVTAVRGVATVSAIAYASYLLGPMAIGFVGEAVGLLTAFLPLLGFLVFVFFAARATRETGRRLSL